PRPGLPRTGAPPVRRTTEQERAAILARSTTEPSAPEAQPPPPGRGASRRFSPFSFCARSEPPVLILLRSVAFNALFYLNLVAHALVAFAAMILSRHAILAVAKSWGRISLWLLRWICGIDVEWQGRERIPKGPLIVASKHQS